MRPKGAHPSITEYADVLRCILHTPKTAVFVSKEAKFGVNTARRILRQFRDLGVAHIAAYDPSIRGVPAAMYLAGHGVDAEMPKPKTVENFDGVLAIRPVRSRVTASVVHFCSVVKALHEGVTNVEAAYESGLSYDTCRLLLQHMKRIGLVHVCAWSRSSSGPYVEVYKFGAGRNKAKPHPISRSERNQASNEKRRNARIAMQAHKNIGIAVFGVLEEMV